MPDMWLRPGNQGVCSWLTPVHMLRIGASSKHLAQVLGVAFEPAALVLQPGQWVYIDDLMAAEYNGRYGQVVAPARSLDGKTKRYAVSVDGMGADPSYADSGLHQPSDRLMLCIQAYKKVALPAKHLYSKVSTSVRAVRLHSDGEPVDGTAVRYVDRRPVSEVYLPVGLSRFCGGRDDSPILSRAGVPVALVSVEAQCGGGLGLQCTLAGAFLADADAVHATSRALCSVNPMVGPYVISSIDGSDLSMGDVEIFWHFAVRVWGGHGFGREPTPQLFSAVQARLRDFQARRDNDLRQAAVVQHVHHQTEEPAARPSAEEAAAVVEAQTASWLQDTADASSSNDVVATTAPSEMPRIVYETVYLLRFTRNPDEFERVLHKGHELEAVRAAMAESGHTCRLPSGASLFAEPYLVSAISAFLTPLALRPYHVITTSTVKPIILEAIHRLPCRSKVRMSGVDPIAMLPADGMQDALVVERTFLNYALDLLHPNSVAQSTTEMHGGGINPRRRV